MASRPAETPAGPYAPTEFAQQPGWSTLPAAAAQAEFDAIAAEIGLNLERWRADAVSAAVSDVVEADRAEAEQHDRASPACRPGPERLEATGHSARS